MLPTICHSTLINPTLHISTSDATFAPVPEEMILPAGLRQELLPNHVAVIMDGNMRWARMNFHPGRVTKRVYLGLESVGGALLQVGDSGPLLSLPSPRIIGFGPREDIRMTVIGNPSIQELIIDVEEKKPPSIIQDFTLWLQ